MTFLLCGGAGTSQRFIAYCAIATGFLALTSSRAGADEVKRVLILYSNESFLPANIAFGNSLVGHMRAELNGRAEFFSEFLDLVRFSGEAHRNRTATALRDKYSGRHIDLLVVAGPQALELMAAHRDALFPGVPLVFAAIRADDPAVPKLTAATGIVMRLDPVPTLELALRLQPGTRRVVVVTGAAEFDRSWEAVARDRFRDHEGRLEFVYMSGLSTQQLQAELRALGADTVVLYLTIFKDGAGRNFIAGEAARLVAEASAVPVYALYDTYIGSGIVGGYMDTFDLVGRETARLGLRVLAGERPEAIAPSFPGEGGTVVDWRQLRRWGLDESLLPPGSDVRFRQSSLWEEHRRTVLAVLAVVVLQTVLMLGLLIQLRIRRRAEMEVRRQEDRFRSVLASAPNVIIMTNAEGNIVLINSRAEVTFGYTGEELVGQPVEALVPERFRAQCVRDRTAAVAYPSPLLLSADGELCGLRKDGSEFPIEIRLTRLQTGEGHFVLSVITDITERKEAEETRQELAHAARLATVGELTASIAHEINQPLGAILSNADAAEILLESLPESLDEVRHILDDIRKDDLRASEVIRRLRTLLRKREMEMQSVDLNEAISEVVGLIRAESGRRGLAIAASLTADLPIVRGDKVHLQQVLLNLLLNGMEAMADGPGEKRLNVCTALDEHGSVEIAVSDTGSGIAPDRLLQLFDPFFTTKKEGMGLGLSIARTLVEAHGGRIWADNNPGGGATFRFTVPTCTQKPARESSETRRTTLELTT